MEFATLEEARAEIERLRLENSLLRKAERELWLLTTRLEREGKMIRFIADSDELAIVRSLGFFRHFPRARYFQEDFQTRMKFFAASVAFYLRGVLPPGTAKVVIAGRIKKFIDEYITWDRRAAALHAPSAVAPPPEILKFLLVKSTEEMLDKHFVIGDTVCQCCLSPLSDTQEEHFTRKSRLVLLRCDHILHKACAIQMVTTLRGIYGLNESCPYRCGIIVAEVFEGERLPAGFLLQFSRSWRSNARSWHTEIS